ncbi:ParA family protein [Larkinella soli]|uniref:ParA family protein n=1 Tax=Larkinella soli TaxID=1770527 RepID=UPI0013E2FB2C|nr:ParA family protein [Larkinella soli]
MSNKKIVCIINMKGGVGKTTLAVNISYTLAKHFNKRVLLIDMDPQMNSTQYCLSDNNVEDILNHPRKSIYGVFEPELPSVVKAESTEKPIETQAFSVIENLDIIPSHLNIMRANIGESPLKLKNYINENKLYEKYDILIIDAPPTISGYIKAALLSSTYYLVPMKIDFLSLFGLPMLQTYINDLSREYESHIIFTGIILTQKHPTHTRIYSSLKSRIEQNPDWQRNLFQNEMLYRAAIANSLSPESGTKFIYELGGDIQDQLVNIAAELIQKIRL